MTAVSYPLHAITGTEPVPLVEASGGPLVRPADAPFTAPYAEHSKAPATWDAYRRDWSQWEAWLAPLGVKPDDATGRHVAEWCEHLADTHKASTVCRKVSSLGGLYTFQGNLAAGLWLLLAIVGPRWKSELDLRKRRLVVAGRSWLVLVSAGPFADYLRTGDVSRTDQRTVRRIDPGLLGPTGRRETAR